MIANFFAMGGYASFVWSAYGVSALGIAGATVLTLRAYFRAKANVLAMESAGPT